MDTFIITKIVLITTVLLAEIHFSEGNIDSIKKKSRSSVDMLKNNWVYISVGLLCGLLLIQGIALLVRHFKKPEARPRTPRNKVGPGNYHQRDLEDEYEPDYERGPKSFQY